METRQHHILYIEDHADTRELVTLVLAQSNYRVTTACSSKDALNLARGQGFDLYILDSRLPDGTGTELCKQLREFDQETPVMFISAAAYETDKQAAIESGAQQYLVKPVDMQVLSSEVSALISSSANKIDQPGGNAASYGPLCRDTDKRAMRLSVAILKSTAL